MKDEEYEGMEVEYIVMGGPNMRAIIAGCDKDLGLTIMEKDTDNYLFCMNGPSSPRWKAINPKAEGLTEEIYKELFELLKEQIESGVVNIVDVNLLVNSRTKTNIGFGVATAESCSFNQ